MALAKISELFHCPCIIFCINIYFSATGVILRCDVFVDTIHRIEIATTTRELLLGETPEVFDVYGYDEEGISILNVKCDAY